MVHARVRAPRFSGPPPLMGNASSLAREKETGNSPDQVDFTLSYLRRVTAFLSTVPVDLHVVWQCVNTQQVSWCFLRSRVVAVII